MVRTILVLLWSLKKKSFFKRCLMHQIVCLETDYSYLFCFGQSVFWVRGSRTKEGFSDFLKKIQNFKVYFLACEGK
jgi:hypothetical protein